MKMELCTDFRNAQFNQVLYELENCRNANNDHPNAKKIIVPIIISGDSLTLFKHSVNNGYCSLSPLLLSVLSFPPSIRYKFVSCIGLIPGPKPINYDLFYEHVLQQLKPCIRTKRILL